MVSEFGGVPYWGLYFKGILLFGVHLRGPAVVATPLPFLGFLELRGLGLVV